MHTRTALALALAGLIALALQGCKSEPVIEDKTLSEWVDLLRHQDLSTQEQAQEILVRHGSGVVPYLRKALRTTDPTLRRNAIRVLGRLGPAAKDAVPALLGRIAREKVALLRSEVLLALALIDPAAPRVQEEFQKRLRDVDADVRASAQAGLDKLDPSKAKPEPAAPKGPEIEQGLVLRDAARATLATRRPGASFGLVAEVARGERRAAVIWPVVAGPGGPAYDLVALVFERRGAAGWVFVEEVGPLAGEGAQRLATALGGSDGQQVLRPCGVKREELVSYLQTWGQAYAEKSASGAPEALEAYEKLTQAFAFPWVAYGEALPDMLAKGAFTQPWKLELSATGDALPVEMTLAGAPRSGQVVLRPCGQGVVVGELRPSTR
ncbi:MAG TPA: HEAT repeat domain-containing protein [Myxococcota bacterium]|nr:HEAT repeat domain-containing protein [Myxococcota bacterium]HRY96404.1 HEAT repeat domain-containing protein [Myxococcota bacterium]HSA23692.1 HEAT repeat domain-containing protein [Myxococcota bacterium]